MNHGDLPTYEDAIQSYTHDPILTECSYPIATFPSVPHSNTVLKPLPPNIKVKVSQKGISSKGLILNSDPELLHSFFSFNNSKPRLWVNIKGYEMKKITEPVHTRDENGNTHSTTHTRTEKKIHFRLSLEVTEEISDTGLIQFTTQSDDQNLPKLFEDYINNKNKLKKFTIKKEVNWDYQFLTKKLTNLIQSRGFRNKIEIKYKLKNDMMKVSSNSKEARCLSHPITQGVCILTCLYPIVWPIAKIYQKAYGKQLIASFPVRITPQQWYQNNMSTIISTIDNYINHGLKGDAFLDCLKFRRILYPIV